MFTKAERGAVNYDLCLMDVNMPIMDGIEAIREIRKNTTYLPVAAHSADPDNEMSCLEAGADEFLLQPRPAAELKRMLGDFSVKQMTFIWTVRACRCVREEDVLLKKYENP